MAKKELKEGLTKEYILAKAFQLHPGDRVRIPKQLTGKDKAEEGIILRFYPHFILLQNDYGIRSCILHVDALRLFVVEKSNYVAYDEERDFVGAITSQQTHG